MPNKKEKQLAMTARSPISNIALFSSPFFHSLHFSTFFFCSFFCRLVTVCFWFGIYILYFYASVFPPTRSFRNFNLTRSSIIICFLFQPKLQPDHFDDDLHRWLNVCSALCFLMFLLLFGWSYSSFVNRKVFQVRLKQNESKQKNIMKCGDKSKEMCGGEVMYAEKRNSGWEHG